MMEEMDVSPAFSPLKSILDSEDEESTSPKKTQLKVKVIALASVNIKQVAKKRVSRSRKMEKNEDNDELKEGIAESAVGGKTSGRKSSLPTSKVKELKNSRASDSVSPKSDKRLIVPLQALDSLKVENVNNDSIKKSITKESTKCDTAEDEADKEQLNDSVKKELPSKKRSSRVLSSSSEENIPLMGPKDWDSDNADNHGLPLKYEVKKKISPFPKQVTKATKVHTARAASSGSDSDDSSDLDLDDDDDVEEENKKRKSRDKKKAPRAPAKKRTRPEYRSPVRRLGESDEENNSEEEGGLELIRKQTEERMNALINSLRNPELEKQFASLKPKNTKPKSSTSRQKKRGGNGDTSFKFSGMIPIEQRKSSRLRNKKPEYTSDVIDELHETMRRTYFKRPNYRFEDHLIEDLEEVVFRPKRKSHGKRKVEERIIIPVEAVTQEMLDNIALRVKGKVYSADGTTCHQCRQKTLDQKTCCRSPDCSGILGMFCGVCIKNRYGEDAAEALLNPNWICPVCRGKCNCSICRTKQGKRPTGILAPLAQQSGYESVDHFLDTLRGEGDRPEDDSRWKLKRDPEALLGFSHNGHWAHFNDGSFATVNCTSCAYSEWDNPDNLLGFSKDGNTAIMGGKKAETLCKPKNEFLSALQLKSK